MAETKQKMWHHTAFKCQINAEGCIWAFTEYNFGLFDNTHVYLYAIIVTTCKYISNFRRPTQEPYLLYVFVFFSITDTWKTTQKWKFGGFI